MSVVDVIIPTYRGIQPEAHSNLHLMIRETQCYCGDHAPWKCDRGKHSIRILPHTRGSSVVHWARNQLIAMALYGQEPSPDGRPDAEYFFLMDDDMLCQSGHLSRLLSYKKDIVTGISTLRRDPPRPNIRLWDAKKEIFFTPLEWSWESNKLMEIDAVGAAFMLIRRRVFEVMGQAWLDCKFEREEDKRKFPRCDEIDTYWDKQTANRRREFQKAVQDDWKLADCWWFEFLDKQVCAHSQIGQLGEDVAFCWKAKKLGFRIFADPQILPGHIGEYGYSIIDYRQWLETGKDLGAIPQDQVVNAPQLVPPSEAHVEGDGHSQRSIEAH